MNKIKERFSNSTLYIFTVLILVEIIFRLVMDSTIFCFAFLRIAIGILMISLSFGYLFSLSGRKINWILNNILIFAASIYAWVQAGFVKYIGVFMSLNVSSQLGAVKEYIGEFLANVEPIFYVILLPFVIALILSFIFLKKSKIEDNKVTKKEKLFRLLYIVIIICLLCIYYFYSLNDKYKSDKFQAISNKDVFLTASNPGVCIKEFGITPFAFIDVRAKLFKAEDEENFTSTIVHTIQKEENDNTRKIDDTLWNELIETEKNKNLNKMNNYYISKDITDKNEYTGLFEGKNLIVIMMESVNDIIYNEDFYPNFSYLANNGWYFPNNYSPRNSCATGNNEFSAMTGLYSIHNTCTINNYSKNTYPYAIFNLFNNKDYITNSFHNYTESYYNRKKFHPSVGSMNYYNANDLKIKIIPGYGGWSSDEDLVPKYFEKIDALEEGTNFMSYITTMTSHQPYSVDYHYDTLYIDLFKETGYSKNVRRYMSKLKTLDNALGLLIDGLKERELYEDTVIVLFGDHFPYGLTKQRVAEVLTRNLEEYDVEKTPLVIFNPSLEAKTIDTYTSYVNLVPTLANLFNLDYDPRLYAGEDVFSPTYDNYVVFADSSWKNDEVYYNASTGKVKYYVENSVYDSGKIREINSVIYDKINSSTTSVKNNYFNYLYNHINKEETE